MSPHRSRPSRLGRVITRYVGLKTALGRSFDGERRVLQALDAFLRTDGGRAADLTPESLSRWTQGRVSIDVEKSSRGSERGRETRVSLGFRG